MTDRFANWAGWKRIWVLIAVLYAIPVAVAVWVSYPTQRKIESDTAWNAIWAVQQHDEKYRNTALKDIRRRAYRGLSDEQVIARIREFAQAEEQRIITNLGGDATMDSSALAGLTGTAVRPKVAVLMEEIDKTYAARLESLKTDQTRTIVWGVAAWVVPMLVLYALGPRLVRPRRRVTRRI